MLTAVVADFSQIPDDAPSRRDSVVTTIDRRLRELPAVAHLEEQARVVWVESPEHERCLFSELARAAQATLVIAPETGGILLERRRMTDAAGGRFLGPTAKAIELCGDKLSLLRTPGAALDPDNSYDPVRPFCWVRRVTVPDRRQAARRRRIGRHHPDS